MVSEEEWSDLLGLTAFDLDFVNELDDSTKLVVVSPNVLLFMRAGKNHQGLCVSMQFSKKSVSRMLLCFITGSFASSFSHCRIRASYVLNSASDSTPPSRIQLKSQFLNM